MDVSYRIHRKLIVEELEPRTAPTLVYQTIPYTQEFSLWPGENAGWTYYSTPSGRFQLYPPGPGPSALRMDSMSSSVTYDLNEAIVHLNLEGQSNVQISFDHRDSYDEPDALPDRGTDWGSEHQNGDGVAISDDNGATWSTLMSLGRDLDWTTYTLDLDMAVAGAGMAYSSTFLLKFQQYDNQWWINPGGDGREFDNVSLSVLPPGGQFDYRQDFSAGKPDILDGWEYYSSAPQGQTHVVDGALRMDSTGGYVLNEAIVHLNLSGENDIKLQFDHSDSYDELMAMPTGTWSGHQNGDGVAISDDQGATWYSIESLGRELNSSTHLIDLDAAIATAGMSYNADFLIKFQQYDNLMWGPDGRELDNIWVASATDPDNFSLNADADGEAYLYVYGGQICSITATDADADAVVDGTWNAGTGTYDITVTNALDSFDSINANYTDFIGESVGSISIGSDVLGTMTLQSFGSSDTLDIDGTLSNLTISGVGGLGGSVSVNQVTGTIATGAGGVTSTGSVETMGDLANMTVGGDMAGQVTIGNDLTGAISVSGDMTSAEAYSISVAGNLGASASILVTGDASSGAEMQVQGEFDGLIRVGSGGAGIFGDVVIGTNVGSAGTLRAYNDNNAATLDTDDITAAQLTYHRDFGSVENNDPDTLFGLGTTTVLSPGDNYVFTDSDGDEVTVTYDVASTGTVTLQFVMAGLGKDIDTLTYAGATDTSALDISVTTVGGNGATTAGDVTATGQVFGTFTVEGWIESWSGGELATGEEISTNPGGALGDLGAMSLENALAGALEVGNNITGNVSSAGDITGTIHAAGDLEGKISASTGVVASGAIDIDGIINASAGGEIDLTLFNGDTSFTYDEGAGTKTFDLVGLGGSGEQGTLVIGGAAGQEGDVVTNEARANLQLDQDATSLTTTNINFKDMDVQTIGTTSIGSDIEGTLTMTSFDSGDALAVDGSVNNFTITGGGGLGGAMSAGSVTGTVTTGAGGVTETGLVDVSGDFNNLTAGGDLAGVVKIGNDLLGSMDISGNVVGGGLWIGGSNSGTITVSSVAQTYVGGLLHGGRNLTGTAEDPNPMAALTINAGDDLQVFWDGVHDVGYGVLYDPLSPTTVTMMYATDHIDSVVSTGLDFSSVRVDGRVKAVSEVILSQLVGATLYSSTGVGLDIGGDVGYLRLDRFDHPDYTIQVDGDLGTVSITEGMLEGTIRTINGGDLTSGIVTAAGQEIRGVINIDGDIASTASIMPGGTTAPTSGEDITGQIVVGGNMEGMIYAYDLGKDVAAGASTVALKGSIEVGGNVTGGIDIFNVMQDYSFIDAMGTIASATFSGSDLTAGVRVQGLAGSGALAGEIVTAIDLDNAISFAIGDDVDNSTRTFTLGDQNLVTNAWLSLDGRNLASSGWTLESPTVEIDNAVSLATLNTLLGGINYDGTANSSTTLASVGNVTLSDFTTAGAGSLTVLNAGDLDITAEALGAGDVLTVENVVWGKIDLGSNAMDGFIDVVGNLTYDVDNGSDGWIISTGQIADFSGGTVGVRVQDSDALGYVGGRITTALNDSTLAAAQFVIGDDATTGSRTFAAAVVGLGGSPNFQLTLDGRFGATGGWTLESPTLELTSGTLDESEWETNIRTSGNVAYDGGTAAAGLSFFDSTGAASTFDVLGNDVTFFNLGDAAITGDGAIGAGRTVNVSNTLYGNVTVGTYGNDNIAMAADAQLLIGQDLAGNLNFVAQVYGSNASPDSKALISIGRNFAEGAEIDYTPYAADHFYGDITVGGDWLGVLDINGTGTGIERTASPYRGSLIAINGNFGSPTVTGALIDIENGRWFSDSIASATQGLRVGFDGTGIMYGDIRVRAEQVSTARGSYSGVRTLIGLSSSSSGDAYMAHTAMIGANSYFSGAMYVYGNNDEDVLRGQILTGFNSYATGESVGIQGTIYVYGGMSEQAEIRAMRVNDTSIDNQTAQVFYGGYGANTIFRNDVHGAIASGDGYNSDDDGDGINDEAFATFGRAFALNATFSTTDPDFTGIVRSFGQGMTIGGEWQGAFSYGNIDVRGDMSGKILGYYLPDIEICTDTTARSFTGTIEAFEAFRGGGLYVRYDPDPSSTLRAGGRDMGYYSGTLTAGSPTLTITTDNGSLVMERDAANVPYQYLYAGSGDTIEALRVEGNVGVQSVIGTGVKLNSFYSEGSLVGGSEIIDFNDGVGDAALYSVRLQSFESTAGIEVEGELGQLVVNGNETRDFAGDVTTTVGSVGTNADLSGYLFNYTGSSDFTADSEVNIAGNVRQTAGLLSYRHLNGNTFNVGGDMRGFIWANNTGFTPNISIGGDLGPVGWIRDDNAGAAFDMAGTIDIGGDLDGRIFFPGTRGSVSGTITVGQDMNGLIYVGNADGDTGANLTGTIAVAGALTPGAVVRIYGAEGISSTGQLSFGSVEATAGTQGRVYLYKGPLTGALSVSGNMDGYIYLGDGTADSGADLTGTIDVGGDMGGFLRVYGAGGISGDIAIAGDLSGSSSTYIRAYQGDLTGNISIGENLSSGAYIEIDGDMTGTSTITVGGRVVSQRIGGAIDINGDVSTAGGGGGYSIHTGGMAAGTEMQIYGDPSTGAEIQVDGKFNGLIQVGEDGAGVFGDVSITPNAGSSGYLQAYDQNNSATLDTNAATAGQLTYTRDIDGESNNLPGTLFYVDIVTLDQSNPTYSFTDSDGDTVDVTYTAAGGSDSVELRLLPYGSGTDIVAILYSNATAASDLDISVSAVVGDGATTSGYVYAQGQTFGSFSIDGWIRGWTGGTLANGETLSTLGSLGNVAGDMTFYSDLAGTLSISGDVKGAISLEGDIAATGSVDIAGVFEGGGFLLGGSNNGAITVNSVTQTYAGGMLHGGRNTGTLEAPNPMDVLTINAADDLQIFWDGIHDVQYGVLYDPLNPTDVAMLYANNSIDSAVASGLNFASIRVDGRVRAMPDMTVSHNDGVNTYTSTGYGIDVTGNVDYLRIQKFDHPDYTVEIDGDLGTFWVGENEFEGTVHVTGDLTGAITTAPGRSIWGAVDVDGAMASTAVIMSARPGSPPEEGEDILGQITIGGNMEGMIYAYNLGNDFQNQNNDVFAIKGKIDVGGNITGGIDLGGTIMDYSSIQALTGTIASATFSGSDLTAGIRVQGLGGTGALEGGIVTMIDLDNPVSFSFGDDTDNSVRTFTLADQNIVGNPAWLGLDGRNLASSGWTLESPTIAIQNAVPLATLNALLNDITYDGTANSSTTLASVSDVTLSDFGTGTGETLTVLNVGNLDISAEALEAGDVLNVENVVWGTLDLGSNNMGGFIDIDNNLVYDADNESDGYIVTTGAIASYDGSNTVGIRVSGLGADGIMGGRIRTAYGDLDAARSWSIGEGGTSARTFGTADLDQTEVFDLMLDGRTVDGVIWTVESPWLMRTSGTLTAAEWESIRTDSGTTYTWDGGGGGAAANGLSLDVGSGSNFTAWTPFTVYNMGDVTLTNAVQIPVGEAITINNDLWGSLNIGTSAVSTYLLQGTIDINGSLRGNLNFKGRLDDTGLIDIAGDFAEGAEIDYSPGGNRDFFGDITVGGDWLGLLDINGAGTDIYRKTSADGTLITINGNFGSPNVTGTLIDVEAGRLYQYQVNANESGLRIGADGSGIMYGDIMVRATNNTTTSYGYISSFRTQIGVSGSAPTDHAYMAHTSRYVAERYHAGQIYIYNQSTRLGLEGQVLAGTRPGITGLNIGIGTQTNTIYGGMGEQGEIRALRGPTRDANYQMVYSSFGGTSNFYQDIKGAVCAGDGYEDTPGDEVTATFGYSFGVTGTATAYVPNFRGVIRSTGMGPYDGGVFQGGFSYGNIDIRGNVRGEIVGFFLPDVEQLDDTAVFTGRIEAFDQFRGGGVRIEGTIDSASTLRAGGQDLTCTTGTLTAGNTLTINTDNGTLQVTADTADVDYQYLYAGSGDTVEALRLEGNVNFQSVLGTGVVLNSFYSEGELEGGSESIVMNDGATTGAGLGSVRLNYFRPGDSISVEGDLGQVVSHNTGGNFEGDITTTVGTVGTTADLTGFVTPRGGTYFYSGAISIAGDVRQMAGFMTSRAIGDDADTYVDIDIGGDFNGLIGASYGIRAGTGTTKTTLDIGGAVGDTAVIRTYGNYPVDANITVGGDFGATVLIGDNNNDTNADITGVLSIGGQLTSSALIDVYGAGGITNQMDIDGGMASGALLRMLNGPISGTLNIGGDVAGDIWIGNATADTSADLSGTINITNVSTDPGLSGTIQVYGQGGISGAVNMDGDLSGSGYIQTYGTGSDLSGTIAIGGNVQDTAYIEIVDDITASGSLTVGGNVSSTGTGATGGVAIYIGDAMVGTLTITGELSGTVDITGTAATGNEIQIGSMSGTGKLLAALFGDVEIMGNFLGEIGDAGTGDGSGNTLQIHSSGNTINGWVTKVGVLQSITGEVIPFDGAFVDIDDLDTP